MCKWCKYCVDVGRHERKTKKNKMRMKNENSTERQQYSHVWSIDLLIHSYMKSIFTPYAHTHTHARSHGYSITDGYLTFAYYTSLKRSAPSLYLVPFLLLLRLLFVQKKTQNVKHTPTYTNTQRSYSNCTVYAHIK